MWLDVHGCDEHFHYFKRVDGKIVCLHGDDSVCEAAEFDVSELVEV